MNIFMKRLAALTACAVALSGCANPPAEPGQSSSVKLDTITTKELMQKVESAKGKIVVLDVWASWCGPCVREFPGLVALHRELSDQGVVCISVSVDDASAARTALGLLKSWQATFANYRLSDKSLFLDEFNIPGYPTVLIFQDGKMLKKLTGESYQVITPFVRDLLKKNEQTNQIS